MSQLLKDRMVSIQTLYQEVHLKLGWGTAHFRTNPTLDAPPTTLLLILTGGVAPAAAVDAPPVRRAWGGGDEPVRSRTGIRSTPARFPVRESGYSHSTPEPLDSSERFPSTADENDRAGTRIVPRDPCTGHGSPPRCFRSPLHPHSHPHPNPPPAPATAPAPPGSRNPNPLSGRYRARTCDLIRVMDAR